MSVINKIYQVVPCYVPLITFVASFNAIAPFFAIVPFLAIALFLPLLPNFFWT